MIRAVLDTNVFISALFWRGAPYQIVREEISGAFIFLTSEEIIEEIKEGLLKKFKLPVTDTLAFLEIITLNSEIIEPNIRLNVIKADPSDNKIVECAIVGNANYIVTGDKHLLVLKEYNKIKIVTPREFIKIIE